MTQTPHDGSNPSSVPAAEGLLSTSVGLPPVVQDPEATLPPAFTREELEVLSALPDGSAMLFVKQGPGAGSRFLLNTERVTAGRADDSDIFLDDVTVSRKHAEFLQTAEGFGVHDRGSLNGTYVNRESVERAVLHSGDLVQIGKFQMWYFTRTALPAQ